LADFTRQRSDPAECLVFGQFFSLYNEFRFLRKGTIIDLSRKGVVVRTYIEFLYPFGGDPNFSCLTGDLFFEALVKGL
jgi:hypothetical protein